MEREGAKLRKSLPDKCLRHLLTRVSPMISDYPA